MFWACVLGRWRATLGTFAYFWLGIGFTIGAILVLVIILGGEITAGPLLVFFLFLAAVLLALLIWDLIQCIVSPSTPPPAPPPPVGGGPLTTQVDCATATRMLADARAQAQQLQMELAAQVARVAAAQQAANAARMGLAGAAATVAASAFAPWMLPFALAGLAAAIYATWQTAKNLEAELANLDSLARRFALVQRDLTAAELMASQACAMAPTPSVPTVGGIGLTVGAMQVIVRGPGRYTPTAA